MMTTAKIQLYKKKIGILILLCAIVPLFPQENPKIAEEAIRGEPIRFINRTRRKAPRFIQEREINTGKVLAQKLLNQKEGEENAILVKRYFDPQLEKYGADVISLTENTNFGHINAIKRIIQGYLETAFEYKPDQAKVLAELLVYYNARLRMHPEILKDSYSTKVLSHIDTKKAGIDRVYRNWAGNSQLLIPLEKNIVRPEKTDLDRKELKEVIKEDKTVPEKKKEQLEKIDQERKKEDIKEVQKKEEEIIKKEEEIKQEKEEIKKEEVKIEKELQDTQKKLEELRKDPVKNQKEIQKEEKKVEELKKQKEEIQEQKKEVQKEEKKIQQEKKEITEQKKELKEEPSTTRKEEVKKENQITENQKEPSSKTQLDNSKKEEASKDTQKKVVSENVINEKIVFLKVIRYIQGGHYNNELWMLDPNQDDTLFRGPFTNICSRTFLTIKDMGIVVIGYEGNSHEQTPHHLFLLDPDTLVVKAKSKEVIMFSSFLIYDGEQIYVVEEINNKFYLSRFNKQLELQARSSSNIHPHSEITFFKDKIYLTGNAQNGNVPIQVYSRKDLKLLKVITPN